MADCKKYNGSTWEHSLRKLTTATDTFTTLPADIYPNDTTATVGLKGQTVQSSTPSSTSPVMPNGCGERTGNLFDEKYPSISPAIQYMPMFVGDGTFTLSTTTPQMSNGAACLFLIAGNVSSGVGPQNKVYNEQSITVDSSNGYITIAYRIVSDYDPRNYTSMLNTGSTPLPYEPYGYKIPISSANTTTPVYLGDVQTTRKIKKLVLTGEESGWQLYQQSSPAWRYEVYQFWLDNIIDSIKYSGLYSTIAPFGVTSQNRHDYEYGCYAVSSGKGIAFQMVGAKDTFTNVTAWKTYLAAQYAAGTPVTVWYVLAEPETGIVNEPLMKIGDYADTVSGISIPTIAGANTLSVDTTLQPSEVTVNYKGWHPVTDVHERDDGAWT